MLDSLILELLDCSGQTLLRASAITFSFPQRNPVLMSCNILMWVHLYYGFYFLGIHFGVSLCLKNFLEFRDKLFRLAVLHSTKTVTSCVFSVVYVPSTLGTSLSTPSSLS